jgi:hypothetical protein
VLLAANAGTETMTSQHRSCAQRVVDAGRLAGERG